MPKKLCWVSNVHQHAQVDTESRHRQFLVKQDNVQLNYWLHWVYIYSGYHPGYIFIAQGKSYTIWARYSMALSWEVSHCLHMLPQHFPFSASLLSSDRIVSLCAEAFGAEFETQLPPWWPPWRGQMVTVWHKLHANAWIRKKMSKSKFQVLGLSGPLMQNDFFFNETHGRVVSNLNCPSSLLNPCKEVAREGL